LDLAGQRPVDLLRDGAFDSVQAAVERLRSGAM
jgi:hypothetical protein